MASSGKYTRPWHVNLLNDTLMRVYCGEINRLIITMPPRHALSVATPIPTPDGWTSMGDLQTGDRVFGADGSVVTVTGVSPIWLSNDVYEVVTNDGETVVADGEHLWEVQLATGGTSATQRTAPRLLTTEEVSVPRSKRPMVRCAGPLQLPDAPLPIDPYVLGVWLGDGTSANGSVTSGADDLGTMRGLIEARGYPTTTTPRSPCRFNVIGLYRELRVNGLLRNKHVPSAYLRGSVHQRRLLLAGLMDTDGTVSRTGQCSFCNTNEGLADAVYELVCSLGYKATRSTRRAVCNGKDCGPAYCVGFYMPDCFRMPRKLLRCVQPVRTNRYVTASRTPQAVFVRCITVDADDGLFLAGRSFLITHNSKSETTSKYTPAWWLGMRPDDRVMLASYEAELATTWGRKARDLLEEYGPKFFGCRVKSTSSAANRWDIENHDGGMVTVGVGGALTGRGANLFIIDDYIRNSEDARSQTMRQKQWDWWTGTARTRIEPGGAVIIMATRWHEEDLIGKILAQQAGSGEEQWHVLAVPAIAKQDEEHRREGEALWPERYPIEALEAIRSDIGNYWFHAEYQCEPSPEDGLVFKRHGARYWRPYLDGYILRQANGDDIMVRKNACWQFCTVDLAASEKEWADYYVVACWAVTPTADMILLDMHRSRAQGPEKIPILKDMMERYDASYVAVESVGFQLDFLQNARQNGLNALKLQTKGDKMARSIEGSIKWESGQIYLPANASWLSTCEEELATFPNGAHDDIVDVLSYAAIEVNKRGFNPDHAYGLVECVMCHKKFARNARVGFDRPCPFCGCRNVDEDDEAA